MGEITCHPQNCESSLSTQYWYSLHELSYNYTHQIRHIIAYASDIKCQHIDMSCVCIGFVGFTTDCKLHESNPASFVQLNIYQLTDRGEILERL